MIKFKQHATIGFCAGTGYGPGTGPYDTMRHFRPAEQIDVVIRPRLGMPEYDAAKERGSGRVDLIMQTFGEVLVAHNVAASLFEVVG